MTTTNIVLATDGLICFDWTKVQSSTFVLRLNFSAKNPAHRQYAVRYSQCLKTREQNESDI
jgi:hypothetical protein